MTFIACTKSTLRRHYRAKEKIPGKRNSFAEGIFAV